MPLVVDDVLPQGRQLCATIWSLTPEHIKEAVCVMFYMNLDQVIPGCDIIRTRTPIYLYDSDYSYNSYFRTSRFNMHVLLVDTTFFRR